MFYREFGASPYDPFAYGLTIALVELPYLAVQASIFTPIIYFMIGFQSNAEKFFLYYLMFLCSIALYTIFGQFLVYVTPSQPVAQVTFDYCPVLLPVWYFAEHCTHCTDVACVYPYLKMLVM